MASVEGSAQAVHSDERKINVATTEYDNLIKDEGDCFSVELDICYDLDTEDSHTAAESFAELHGCDAVALTRPSGNGWPVYRFSGEREAVVRLLTAYQL